MHPATAMAVKGQSNVRGQHRAWLWASLGHSTLLVSLLIARSAATAQPAYQHSPDMVSDEQGHTYHQQVDGHDSDSFQHYSTVPEDQYFASADPSTSFQRGHVWSPSQQQLHPAQRLDQLAQSRFSSSTSGGSYVSGSYYGSGSGSNGNYGPSSSSSGNYGSSSYGNYGSSSSNGNYGSGSDSSGGGGYYGGQQSTKETAKTFVVIDPTNLIDFALQVTIPFSFDYSFLGLGRRRKRDVSAGDGFDDEEVLGDVVSQLLELNLARLRSVFKGLGVHESDCLEEVICVIHRRPADYQPLPALINRVLRHDDLKADYEMHLKSMNSSSALDYSRYVRAIRRGAHHPAQPCSSCQSGATRCSTAVESILERPKFKFVHYVNTFARSMRVD